VTRRNLRLKHASNAKRTSLSTTARLAVCMMTKENKKATFTATSVVIVTLVVKRLHSTVKLVNAATIRPQKITTNVY
jgi:hypothetical protein